MTKKRRFRQGGNAMKYAIWVVRFWYAGWILISGGPGAFLSHLPTAGEPTHTKIPLQHEMLYALLDSHLFDIVKAVELITGVSVLFGLFTPAILLVCMPVAFCVFWWDSPLARWNSSSVIAGARVLASNVLLSVAFIRCYRSMFAPSAKPRAGTPAAKQILLACRLIFGAWMLSNGINHFFLSLWPIPTAATGRSPLEPDGRFRSHGAV